MEIIFGWFLFSIVVGVAANTRGRFGFGWFILSVLISPLFAGLLVLALPRGNSDAFRPDGMLGQTPFRTLPNGEVEAMLQGAPVRFRSVGEMQLMTAPNATIVSSVPPSGQSAFSPDRVIVITLLVTAIVALIAARIFI